MPHSPRGQHIEEKALPSNERRRYNPVGKPSKPTTDRGGKSSRTLVSEQPKKAVLGST
jgi:hypothetical protein